MSKLSEYQDKYEFIRIDRADGILTISIHENGGAARWHAHQGGIHDELGLAFYDIGRDPENRVVILTGTGDVFLTEWDASREDPKEGATNYWHRLYKEGKDLLMNYLDIEVPVIAAVNGPAAIHAEIPTMADIVLAAEHATFSEVHVPYGIVPGDGVQVWWQMVLGPNRGRHFILSGNAIDAHEALNLGFVAEVLPREQLMARAREIATELAAKPIGMLRSTRGVMVQHLKKRLLDELGPGLSLEALNGILEQSDGRK